MAGFKFQPAGGASDLFDVLVNDYVVGIVWTRSGRWHAAESSMADWSINEPTREEAAKQLLFMLRATANR